MYVTPEKIIVPWMAHASIYITYITCSLYSHNYVFIINIVDTFLLTTYFQIDSPFKLQNVQLI